MPVLKDTIKQQILALGNEMLTQTDQDTAADLYATKLAGIIADAILSADVQLGIAVQVAPSTGTGATTATGTLK